MAKTASRARGRARVSGFVGARRRSCRAGAAAASAAGDHSRPFDDILDDVAMRAAFSACAAGLLAAGRRPYVRSAGEEAWLGREAPENPAFDASDETADARLDDSDPPVHARSLAHAMEIARDRDRVLLLRGVHNGLGVTADVRRRIRSPRRGRAPRGASWTRAPPPRVSNPSLVRDSKRGGGLHRVLRARFAVRATRA